jgi:formamidopyrimidine-DNA glycosylase
MPELPEVECTVRYLKERLRGQIIQNVRVNWKKSIAKPAVAVFTGKIRGAKFKDFSRRGKYIVLGMESNEKDLFYLIAHLRMSGSFDVVNSGSLRSKHDQVVFELAKNKELRFHDIRKFGKIYLVDDKEEILSKLGIEPVFSEHNADDFYSLFQKYKTPIKTLLLRQDIIAGVGNIYADEALWAAKIHPLKLSFRLKKSEAALLYRVLKRILLSAIESSGTDNGDNVVEGGMYKPRAYGRAGEKCYRCGNILRRIIVSQRGTAFCPKCQKLR